MFYPLLVKFFFPFLTTKFHFVVSLGFTIDNLAYLIDYRTTRALVAIKVKVERHISTTTLFYQLCHLIFNVAIQAFVT